MEKSSKGADLQNNDALRKQVIDEIYICTVYKCFSSFSLPFIKIFFFSFLVTCNVNSFNDSNQMKYEKFLELWTLLERLKEIETSNFYIR
jgi:hypothetical protein